MKLIIQVHNLTGGGAERVAASWANGLSSIGHNVSILTDTGQPITYSLGSEIKLIPRSTYKIKNKSFIEKIKNKILNPLKAFKQYVRLLNDEKPDAIISVLYLNQYAWLFARLFARHKCPIIMTDHNAYELPEGMKMSFKKKRRKFFDNRFFDKVTVLTKLDKEILEKKGFKNVEVLYNPLFLSPIKEVPDKEKIVLACGRLNDWHYKGFDLLMKAWSQIGPKYPDWKLRLVGHGSDRTKEMLRDLAGPGRSNLEIADYTSDIKKEYDRAAIFVLSSRYEGWGLVMVEAMSQGCAVIACDFKGRQAEAIQDMENGVLCKTDDVSGLIKKLALLIENENLRTKLQQRAPETVTKFQEEKVAKGLEEVITSAVSVYK